MSPRNARRAGLTLLEVLAAAMLLALVYTMLAGNAMQAVRSEGLDRRRAEAGFLADNELTQLEAVLATGAPFQDGIVEKDADPYTVVIEVQPTDVLALVPRDLRDAYLAGAVADAPALLVDERGQSRVRRLSVIVEWDEAGAPERVVRTTFAYDTSVLATLFPEEEEEGAGEGEGEEAEGAPEEGEEPSDGEPEPETPEE
jgi:type II secretory pathway pseudopilin PulG